MVYLIGKYPSFCESHITLEAVDCERRSMESSKERWPLLLFLSSPDGIIRSCLQTCSGSAFCIAAFCYEGSRMGFSIYREFSAWYPVEKGVILPNGFLIFRVIVGHRDCFSLKSPGEDDRQAKRWPFSVLPCSARVCTSSLCSWPVFWLSASPLMRPVCGFLGAFTSIPSQVLSFQPLCNHCPGDSKSRQGPSCTIPATKVSD